MIQLITTNNTRISINPHYIVRMESHDPKKYDPPMVSGSRGITHIWMSDGKKYKVIDPMDVVNDLINRTP